jgi:hypothetical protein
MKKSLSVILSSLMLLSVTDLSAARGGRGGGAGRGGGGRPGGGYSPKPSPPAARPAPRPSRGTKPDTLPAPGGAAKPRPPGGSGPGAIKPRPKPPSNNPPGGRPGSRDVGNNIGRTPPGHFPGTPGHRPGYGGYHKAEFHKNIHVHFPYHPQYGHPFSRGWCGHFHWHFGRWPYWTTAATAVTLTRWIGWSYSGYGSAEQVPYYPVEPAPAGAYDDAVTVPQEIVDAGEAANVADDSEFMNLGTFGIIPYKETDFAYGVQLAATKDGVLRGIQWDMKKNTMLEIEGSIQKDTLRIAWQSKTPDGLMFETNVDELTEQESMVNVYNPVSKQLVSWQLIQIDEKDLPPKP